MKKKKFFVKKISQDELSSMSDEDLHDSHAYLVEQIENAERFNNEEEAKAWQVELTYAQRELETRRLRFQIHETYKQELRAREIEFEREEERLPTVNFDNFVPGRNNV